MFGTDSGELRLCPALEKMNKTILMSSICPVNSSIVCYLCCLKWIYIYECTKK